jgi:hypothetical protein
MGQGRWLLWGIAGAAIGIAIAGAAPAAASRGDCLRGATKANRFSESNEAIVVRKDGKLYGCVFKRGVLHRLPDDGGRIMRDTIHVERRKTAYGVEFSGGAVISVYSARLGIATDEAKWVASQDPRWDKVMHWGENVVLSDLDLRPNGSIAWEFSWPAEGDGDPYSVVLGFDHGANGNPRFHKYDDDTGSESKIVESSVEIVHNRVGATGWQVTWRRDNGAAPIRRDLH